MTMASQSWGHAWLASLADLTTSLRRRDGAVVELDAEPGLLTAVVDGRAREPRRVRIGVRAVGDDAWSELATALPAGLALELSAGRVPVRLVDVARECGFEILPGPGDLAPECSCGAWDDRCGHVAAVLEAVADRVEVDAGLVVTLRGGDPERLVAVSSQNSVRPVGVSATTAWRRVPQPLPPEPAVLAAPHHPIQVPAPPEDSGVRTADLQRLAGDAAQRAAQLVAVGSPVTSPASPRPSASPGSPPGMSRSHAEVMGDVPLGVCPVELDVVRRVADTPAGVPPVDARTAARLVGLDPDEVERRVVAWRVAGPAGVAVVADGGRADRGGVDRGGVDAAAVADGLGALGGSELAVARSGRITRRDGSWQLRRDAEGRWWGLAPHPDLGWVLDSGPSRDPLVVVGQPTSAE